ncbi:MAG TPA: hypothetical protein VMH83_15290 [Candidatus Acidoferrum sp.]|nr:hypothetical protein [Candidatus Acidoferrum sp.]
MIFRIAPTSQANIQRLNQFALSAFGKSIGIEETDVMNGAQERVMPAVYAAPLRGRLNGRAVSAPWKSAELMPRR